MIKVFLALTMVVLTGCSGSNGGDFDNGSQSTSQLQTSTGAGGESNATCVGVPIPCESQTYAACATNPNCSYYGQCNGTASSYYNTDCSLLASDETDCQSITGCSWAQSCSTPDSASTTCAVFSDSECANQVPGCITQSAAQASPTGSTDGGVTGCGGTLKGTWRLETQLIPTAGFFYYDGCSGAPIVDGAIDVTDSEFSLVDIEACQDGDQSLEGAGSYTVNDGVVTVNDGTDPPETFDYCVQGQYLTIVGADGPMMFVSVQ